MARRKSLFKLKLPFFKFKINKYTLTNIFGFIFLGSAVLLAVSFAQQGDALIKINYLIYSRFGPLSIVLPILILLFASHFFNTHKLKLIKPHLSIGLTLIFIAFLG